MVATEFDGYQFLHQVVTVKIQTVFLFLFFGREVEERRASFKPYATPKQFKNTEN